MKPEVINKYYIVNGTLTESSDLSIFERMSKPPIYEIIRVVKGVPLFLEDHLDRMYDSAEIINHKINISEYEIRDSIKETISRNNFIEGNIKLMSGEADGVGNVFIVFCISSFYPPQEYYDIGINTILYNYERNNPNAKILISSFKEDVAKKMKEKDAFEALLVRRDGYIPEGSRSNIFFVKEGKLYTAPQKEILLGITRKHVFKIAQMLNIKIIEESIHVDDMEKIDGVFMTGTSVNILPISKVEDIVLESINNKIIIELNRMYNKIIDEYVEKNKMLWK